MRLCRCELKLGAFSVAVEPKHRNLRPRQLERSDRTCVNSHGIQIHDLLERDEVVARQFEAGLRQQYVNDSLPDVKYQLTDCVEQLRLCDVTGKACVLDSIFAFVTGLGGQVNPPGVLCRSSAVGRAEVRTEQVKVIGAETEHRVRPEPGGNHLGVGDTEIQLLSEQAEVVLDRLIDCNLGREHNSR